MEVSIDKVERMQRERIRINSADLSDITFTQRGRLLVISKETIDQFKFTGLNNVDFITSGAYKGK